jgi:hypothetical protein
MMLKDYAFCTLHAAEYLYAAACTAPLYRKSQWWLSWSAAVMCKQSTCSSSNRTLLVDRTAQTATVESLAARQLGTA